MKAVEDSDPFEIASVNIEMFRPWREKDKTYFCHDLLYLAAYCPYSGSYSRKCWSSCRQAPSPICPKDRTRRCSCKQAWGAGERRCWCSHPLTRQLLQRWWPPRWGRWMSSWRCWGRSPSSLFAPCLLIQTSRSQILLFSVHWCVCPVPLSTVLENPNTCCQIFFCYDKAGILNDIILVQRWSHSLKNRDIIHRWKGFGFHIKEEIWDQLLFAKLRLQRSWLSIRNPLYVEIQMMSNAKRNFSRLFCFCSRPCVTKRNILIG